MEEYPGVIVRDGPLGRRTALVGGPDVWEVIRAMRSAREAEPELSEEERLALVADNGGVSLDMIHLAVRYWAAHLDQVDGVLAHDVQSSPVNEI